jgi:propanol-preferring alcohol dehydrogenase
MRAAVLTRPAPASEGPLVVTDLPDPRPGEGEVVLSIGACAVCRTDLQIAEGDLAARRLPIIPGHQAVGRVVEVGPDVSGWREGDRAAAYWLAGSCGRCRFCRSGRENLCPEATFHGWDRDGGFAERMRARADHLARLPDGDDDVEIAPLLCGGVIGYRALRVSGIRPGGRLGLLGFGASALCAIQVARHWGCDIAVMTRSDAEKARAVELGAAWAGGYDETPPWPLEAAVTFAPVGDVVLAALRALDRGGTVAINAIHLDRVPEFPYEDLWLERSLRSVANVTRADADEFLRLAAEIPVRTVVEPHPLEDVGVALGRLADGSVGGAAVLTM